VIGLTVGLAAAAYCATHPRALAPGRLADVPLVQGRALWGAVLIVTVSVLADLVLVTLDPRVR
jgi:hypothetical protein